MTKRSDALANAIANTIPKFVSVGSFIYHRNPILMLRGFAFDMPPGGCYIWKYYFPLFGNVDFLHMGLAYRISNGYIETKGKDLRQVANEALPIIKENDDFQEDESLEELVSFSRNGLVSPIERSKLFKDIECFQHESIGNILKRADINRERIGISK